LKALHTGSIPPHDLTYIEFSFPLEPERNWPLRTAVLFSFVDIWSQIDVEGIPKRNRIVYLNAQELLARRAAASGDEREAWWKLVNDEKLLESQPEIIAALWSLYRDHARWAGQAFPFTIMDENDAVHGPDVSFSFFMSPKGAIFQIGGLNEMMMQFNTGNAKEGITAEGITATHPLVGMGNYLLQNSVIPALAAISIINNPKTKLEAVALHKTGRTFYQVHSEQAVRSLWSP
ncbi:MAG: hypothetical protein M3362_25855, partial [Acidobacteriota bacterium]|nr:hypothetical protein [Acidobacteriota bacterium]